MTCLTTCLMTMFVNRAPGRTFSNQSAQDF